MAKLASIGRLRRWMRIAASGDVDICATAGIGRTRFSTKNASSAPGSTIPKRPRTHRMRLGSPVVLEPAARATKYVGSERKASPGALFEYTWPRKRTKSLDAMSPVSSRVRSIVGVPLASALTSAY